MNQTRMATSSSDKEMITIAEEELSRLCRQLRIMEEDRIAFLDETASKLEKQKKIIQILKKERDKISEDINIATCKNQKRNDEKLSKNIYKLLEDFQKYDICVKNEKDQLRELEVQMKKNTSLSNSPVMCSPCSKNLQKSFEFKTTLLSRNDYLKTFLIGETKVVNLQEIITKRKIPGDVIKEEEEQICRFCLRYHVMEHLIFIDNTGNSFMKDLIDRCFPEIDLRISADPQACRDCLESLQHLFNFMAQSCDSEQLIMNYMTFENIPLDQEINLHNVHDYTMKTRCDFENSIYFIKQEKENVGTYKESDPDDEFHEETGSKACEADNNFHIDIGSTYKDCGFSPRLGPRNKSGTNFACSHCPYRTNRRDSLVSHLIVHKTSDSTKIHKCELCNFQSKWRSSLSGHLLCHKKLTDLTMYKCNECAYQSKYKKHLRRHMKTHTSGTLFSCQFCRCKSKYLHYIKNHKCKQDLVKLEVKLEPEEIKVEPEEPVVECPVDGSTFTRLTKPSSNQCWWYKCNYCEYETRKSYHMKEHVMKHFNKDEMKLNECDMCDFKTKYRASLSHHKKQVHKKKDVVV